MIFQCFEKSTIREQPGSATAIVVQYLLYQMARTSFFSVRVWLQNGVFNSLVKPLMTNMIVKELSLSL